MSNYPNVAAEAGDRYLEMLAQGQDRFVEYVRSAREFMPQMPAQFAAQAPAAPFALPSAREFADAQFEFATKLLKQQEGFIRKLYNISAPAKSAGTSASRASSRSTSRSSGSKSRSSARKTTRKSRA